MQEFTIKNLLNVSDAITKSEYFGDRNILHNNINTNSCICVTPTITKDKINASALKNTNEKFQVGNIRPKRTTV